MMNDARKPLGQPEAVSPPGKLAYATPSTAPLVAGRRSFFKYRDLGVTAASSGKMRAQVTIGADGMTQPTGWHYHVCDFQIVIMMKGWAKFMYEDKVTLVEAGDVVHQRPGMVHYLFDYSPDMEYLEIVSPADFGSVLAEPATVNVPPVTPWK